MRSPDSPIDPAHATSEPSAVISALSQRIAEWMHSTRASDAAPRSITVGDLRVIDAASNQVADRQIGCVTRVDAQHGYVEILLVHSAPELATDRDVVASATHTTAPYAVVVQTDLRAVVWTTQIGRRVGQLGREALAAVRAVVQTDVAAPSTLDHILNEAPIWTGARLASPLDGRWHFKLAEGQNLRQLSSDCTEALLTGYR